jgi:hypothetical protein
MYRFVLSELFECQLVGSETYAFLAQYRKLVQWWIDQASETHRSYDGLRDNFYSKWRVDWAGYNSQHAQTSSLVAHSILKSSKQTSTKEENFGYSFAVVSPSIVKIEDCERLVFPTRFAKKAQVRLITKTVAQRVLLEQAQNGYWKLGQTLITDKWCAIPFTRKLDLTSEKDKIIQSLL